MPTVMAVTGTPKRRNETNGMWCPSFSSSPTVVTLALAPIRVPLPPRQAPSASDHGADALI